MKRYLLSFLFLAFLLPALAQDNVDAEEEKSAFLNWVENQISTPDRRISISRIDGVLSSNARVGRITIADREGVWLTIEDAEIVWTRTALLRGRLAVDRLAAGRIEMSRRPLPAEGAAPSPEASGFSLPDLPVSVALDELDIDRIVFAEAAFGLASELTLSGSLHLDEGTFAAELDGERLDGPGGTLDLTAAYNEADNMLEVDFQLDEPENGVIANLLNLYGRPAVALNLTGSGPVEDFELRLGLDADAQRVLSGTARLEGAGGANHFTIAAEGPIGELVVPSLRDLFGENSRLALEGARREGGGLTVSRFEIESGALALNGSAQTSPDGFPTRIELQGRIASADGEQVILPVPGGATALRNASLHLDFGGGEVGSWTGGIQMEGFSTAGYAAERFDLDLDGAANHLADPARREVTLNLLGRASGLSAEKPELQQAIGDNATLRMRSAWRSGEPFRIEAASLETRPLDAELAGEVREGQFEGRFLLTTSDASVLADAMDRPLKGTVRLSGTGRIAPVSGAFDLELDGRLQGFATGTPSIDGLISGEATLTGRAMRDERGIGADNLVVKSEGLTARAHGLFGTETADFELKAEIADLARVSGQMSGPMQAQIEASGTGGRIGLNAALSLPDGTLSGKSLRQGELGFAGMLHSRILSGKVSGSGFLDGERVGMSADVVWSQEGYRLDNLDFQAGLSRIRGEIGREADGFFRGTLAVDAPDVATLSAFLLTEATGSARATILLSAENEEQNARIDGRLSQIETGDIRIASAEIDARLTNLFGVPGGDGTLRASDVRAFGVEMQAITANARQEGERTGFEAGARFENGASLAAAGALTRIGEGFRLDVFNLDLVRDRVLARLATPASILLAGDALRIDALELEVDGGRVRAQGSLAQALDLAVELSNVPLATANSVVPDLGLSGVIDGTLTIGGQRDRPDVQLDLQGRNLGARVLAEAGIPPLEIRATGRTDGRQLQLNAGIAGQDGMDARLQGAIPLDNGRLALDLSLRSFPLALMSRMAPGLAGNLSGTARIAGTLQRPEAQFDLQGTGVRAGMLSDAGIGALELSASGTFAEDMVMLSALRASGPDGLNATASGRIPIGGRGLDLAVDATAPLGLANRFLSGGATATGAANFKGRIAGSLSDPEISGRVTASGAGYSDPSLQVAMRDISVNASIDRNRVVIESARAAMNAGGFATARGSLQLDADAGFPADLAIRLDQARYVDGTMVAATLSGDLAVSGALARDPLISGSIRIDRAEILVPDQLGGALSAIDVRHVNPPRDVQRTLALVHADDGTPVPSSRPSVARLDVAVVAANRIFLRGRGLDAELGGSVRLTGPITDIQPTGGFQLVRGRLAILGKRIVFDRGEVTLVGDLDPFVDFLATSDAGEVVVMISVAGRVSDPEIRFSSQPELPQDEVLARLIFGRGISELSVLQMARLAAAAASLVGGGNSSLMDGFRQATGLDELDVITDSSGNPALRAGRYIRDNIYLGVEAGAGGETRATVNIDLTGDLKAKGSTGTDGDSSLGIFFEKDY